MTTVWFAVVMAMLTVYVVLDGFDFGVGVLHRYVARNDAERRMVLSAIGPVWDGNEVWLLAAGGAFFCAFPRAYAAAFSGFYLPLVFVLWLLIIRGLAIELRSHHDNPLWREFWDAGFAFASTLMAIVLGASLANVIRGVPIDETGYFSIPLFAEFLPGKNVGVLDGYTALVGVFTLGVLTGHGALFLAWKTTGPLFERSVAAAKLIWLAVLPLWVATTVATAVIQPSLFTNLWSRPWSVLFIFFALAGAAGVFFFLRVGRELAAFLSSGSFLVGVLSATMAGQYPVLLRSNIDSDLSLTATNAAAGEYGLQVGFLWWLVGISLAAAYFVRLFRSFRGKIDLGNSGLSY